jgi:hypothetical protein
VVRVVAVVVAVGLVVLFGAASARAVPIVSFKCTPDPSNCNGWYRTNVSINWTVAPPDAVVGGCLSKTYTTDTKGTNELCVANDGEAEVSVQVQIKVDKTAPVVTGGSPGRGADVNGWYNRPVGIAFSGSDQTSGIAACTNTTYSGPDSGTASVAGTCTDNAGNTSAPLGYGLKYDATAPVISGAVPDHAANAAGWFNSPVRLDMQASDATSGIADCPSLSYGGPDTAGASLTGTCSDRAGNSSSRAFPIKYDATRPAVSSGEPARGADANGWYNRPVGVAFNGTDQTSGVSSCTSTTFSGPDSGTASVPGTCTDRAGNTSTPLAFPLKYDATQPTVTSGQAARTPDANGWYDRPVSISFSGSDGTSGVAGCTTRSYDGPDSATASVAGTCTDAAGNTSSPSSFALKYDDTGPVVTSGQAERPPDHTDWFTHPVRFDFTGTDATSGLASCPPVTYTGPDAANGAVVGVCQDQAGNSSSRDFPLKYDATAPVVEDLGAAGGDRSVSLSWRTSADVGSVEVARTPGLGSEPASVVFRGPGSAFVDSSVANGVRYEYEVRVQDLAGNTGSGSVAAVPAAPPPPPAPPAPPAPPVSGAAPTTSAPVAAPKGQETPAPKGVRRLLGPANGAVLRLGHPPLLEWTPVRGARYYNVQLFRAGRKILSVWPVRPRYQLERRWKYAGKPRHLAPGKYRWLVWPGFGPRSKNDYGRRIGPGTFEVRRFRASGGT